MIIGALVFLMLGCFLFFGVCIGLCSIHDVVKDVERMYAHPFIAGMVGVFFLFIGYIAVKIITKRTGRDELFVVDNGHGRTSIAISAVYDFTRKKLNKYDFIKRAQVKISARNRVLTLSVSLVLFTCENATECVEKVREDLHKTLKNFIGLPTENLNVSVKLNKMVEKKIN
jgi:hypothetical protein